MFYKAEKLCSYIKFCLNLYCKNQKDVEGGARPNVCSPLGMRKCDCACLTYLQTSYATAT